jgi:hypothetical protein
MRNRRFIAGILIGLCLAAIVLPLMDHIKAVRARRGPIVSECDGAITEMVVQYLAEAGPIAAKALRDFLRQLPPGIRVWVVCPEPAAYDNFLAHIGPVKCALTPLMTGHAMTTWSRDRWVALAAAGIGRPATLLSPRAEGGAEIWPQRAGDARIADDLALAGSGIRSERLALYFDGGDFCADDRTVFVAPSVLRRNIQRTVRDREELLDLLARLLGRRVILFDEAPDHHVAMYMTPVGDDAVLVGDPALAQEILRKNGEDRVTCCPTGGGDDFTPATRARFDAVAAECGAAGYRVVRIPVVPGCDGRTWLTWTNVVMDQRSGHRIAYLPRYGKVAALDEAAAEVWSGLGYEIRPVDCSAVYPNFGSLGCLVNVLRRG